MIREKLVEGRVKLQALHNAGEAVKLGTLRGGSSGAIIDGVVYGHCHRKAHLRQLGIDAPTDPETSIMFSAGFANEDIVKAELVAAGYAVKAEEEIPVSITLSNGTVVNGRPDLVLLDKDGHPYYGIELKLASSVYTVRDVHYSLVPKREHLIQAALYSYGLGSLPYSLVYVSRNYWHLSMLSDTFKKAVAAKGWDVEFAPDFRTGKPGPFRIVPFEREYKLTWSADGYLVYDTEGLSKPRVTKLKVQHILDFYEETAAIGEHKDLGPRPTDASFDGTKKTYSPCNYCPFQSVCDEHETDYDTWLDYAKKEVSK